MPAPPAPSSTPPLPAPTRLRLVARTARKPPAPPFGLTAFVSDGSQASAHPSDAPDALAIALDVDEGWPASGLGDLALVVDQIPRAYELAPGTLVVVLGEATRPGGVVRALLGRTRARVARSLRSSALLAQGFVDLGGGVDPHSGADVAWAYAPRA